MTALHTGMHADLAGFQDAFAAALLDPEAPAQGPIAALVSQPGFAVYRNTVMKGCIDVLQANYPAVARLVGEEWFRAAAAVFVRAHPPRVPMLAEYGADFAQFLSSFEPAQDLPYLPAVAQLDRAWTEAHQAADAPALEATALAAFTPEQLAALHLVPHPAARWHWFADAPAYSIWSQNRSSASDEASDIEWRGEGARARHHHPPVERRARQPEARRRVLRAQPHGMPELQAAAG